MTLALEIGEVAHFKTKRPDNYMELKMLRKERTVTLSVVLGENPTNEQ